MASFSQNGLNAVRSYIVAVLGQRITFQLRNQIYEHVLRQSLSFYNRRDTGTILTNVTGDVGRLQGFLSKGLQDAIRDILTISFVCGILFVLEPKLAFLALLPLPFLLIVTFKFSARIHDTYLGLWRCWAGINALLADTIPGVRIVKAFAQEAQEVEKFRKCNESMLTKEINVARIQNTFTPVMAIITSISTLVVWLVGGNSVLADALTLGNFVAFTQYVGRLIGPVENFM